MKELALLCFPTQNDCTILDRWFSQDTIPGLIIVDFSESNDFLWFTNMSIEKQIDVIVVGLRLWYGQITSHHLQKYHIILAICSKSIWYIQRVRKKHSEVKLNFQNESSESVQELKSQLLTKSPGDNPSPIFIMMTDLLDMLERHVIGYMHKMLI